MPDNELGEMVERFQVDEEPAGKQRQRHRDQRLPALNESALAEILPHGPLLASWLRAMIGDEGKYA